MSRYIVARANILVFFVLAALLLGAGGATWDRFEATQVARAWVRHSYEVLSTLKDLGLAIRDAEMGELRYVLSGDEQALTSYDTAVGHVPLLQGDLQQLMSDNPEQQQRLRTLSSLVQRKLQELAQTVQRRRDGGLSASLQPAAQGGIESARRIDGALAEIMTTEASLLSRRLATARVRARWVIWLVAGLTLLASGTLIWAARMLNQAWARSYRAEQEQRLVAQRLRTSLDSLTQGVGVFGPDWALINWNECFQVLLDVPAEMLRPGIPYSEFQAHVGAQDGARLLESPEQVRFGSAQPQQPILYERIRADGQVLEIRRSATPDGGFVLTISDMTKRAQAEAVLREAQKMQAMGQLTGGIAHDFNNLLTVVLGNLEFIRSKPSDENRLQTRVERAIWAAQRGAMLTKQLLAFARKQPLQPTALDLSTTIPELIPLLQRTLGEHIDVRYVETAGLWPAMADPAQLESAVLNLALNARDAMPEGGRLTIEVANKVLDATYAARHSEITAGDYTMLAVSDTGHGMTPDVAARVFEPFFTTKMDGKGTGLGLAMVFGFVKQSGGHVKVYSEPGEGTTVRIYLPRAAQLPSAPRRVLSPVAVPAGSATVLVVEDEPAVREIAVAILQDLGYCVLQAGDGEEGLHVFGAHAPAIDLLLTDVVLAGKMRGRELAERIQAIRPEVRVLYMSGYTENSIVHNGRLDDGVQLISKPFKREELALKVAETLGDQAKGDQTNDGKIVPFGRAGS